MTAIFRIPPQSAFNFDELAVDNFAGGGGASTGIEAALGRPVDIAINHDIDAVRMHETNHPHTHHYCESVWEVDPVKVTNGRPVGVAWFSPDCKHFSKAKGGRPVQKEIRGLAWVMVRWGMTVKPRIMPLENVEEFTTWGPLKDGRPCPDLKGQTFEGFKLALSTGLSPRHPAWREAVLALDIEFNIKEKLKLFRGLGYKIEHRELVAADYGAPTTRKRLFLVARCDGQPIRWPEPTHGKPDSKGVKSGKLKPWRTAAEIIDWSIPCPSIFDRKRPLAENTLKRIAKGIQKFVIDNKEPFIVTCNHSGNGFRGQGLADPFKTVTASRDAHGLVDATLAPFITEHANASNQRNMAANEPVRTLCAGVKGGHFAVVAPIIERQFGNSECNAADAPLGTVTAGGGGKAAACMAFMAKHNGGATGHEMSEPLHTITGRGTQLQVATSHLIKMRNNCTGSDQLSPVPTITAGGQHLGEVRAFLLKYYGNEKDGCNLNDPLHTVPTKDRFGIVMVHGEPYQIVDIGMRMLQPHELFAAQGFPDDYIIDHDHTGKKFTKTAQVARCGNSVCPPIAEALIRANMAEVAQGVIAA